MIGLRLVYVQVVHKIGIYDGGMLLATASETSTIQVGNISGKEGAYFTIWSSIRC